MLGYYSDVFDGYLLYTEQPKYYNNGINIFLFQPGFSSSYIASL